MGNNKTRIYGNSLLSFMENSEFVIAMRRGLLLCIPFFIIGSFCTMITSFPAEAYQVWIQEFLGGLLYNAVLLGYEVTLGTVTLYVILAVSYSYASHIDSEEVGFYVLTSIGSYMFFTQDSEERLTLSIFNSNWLFTGMLITLISCFLFKKFHGIFKQYAKNKYQTGIDKEFSSTVASIIPIMCIVIIWIIIRLLLAYTIGWNLQNIGSVMMMKLFQIIGTGAMGAFVFVFLIHILWFFGIHGSNMMTMVSEKLFEAGMLENIAAMAVGSAPEYIFTKTFFDVFVLMGGSGTTICLLAALLFQRKKKDRLLFKVSILPALFNINEIVLFGLPVVFNPIMIIPFVLVPMMATVISAVSMYVGLVPIPTVQVAWTTPVFFSGYLSTGSIAGIILQVVIILIGVTIYVPFIKISETYYDRLLRNNINSLQEEIRECEEVGEHVDLKSGPRSKRDIVKALMKDLDEAIKNDTIMLYYQPQVTSDDEIYGVEALLRWKHPVAGFLYPPLVIELARQDNCLDELGIMLIEKAAKDLEYLAQKLSRPIHMSVNISPVQFESDTFCPKVEAILQKYDFRDSTMCFEITEQMALSTSGIVSDRIDKLKRAGIPFHMDDFGMGHSSMKYLQSNEFEAVKLDGSLIKQMLDNDRSQNIISGIQQMSLPLNYELIAEYVETEEQRMMLRNLGCHIYQGTLYSYPVPIEQLEQFLEKYKAYKNES